MVLDVNVLTNWWTITGVIASFLIAAIALGLGIHSNKQLKYITAKERKERNLNRIIDWATQILESGRDPISISKKEDFGGKLERVARVNVLSWKAVHIGYLAASIGEGGIEAAVEDTRVLIRQHAKLLYLDLTGKLKHANAIGKHRGRIDDKAKIVIEIAVKLL